MGKVYLVGAGPGHPQLITLKGHELICRADVIIYDRLIQEEILAGARPDAERIYVGKQPGLHQSRQERINQMMVEAAGRAQVVVRLKGGDPVLFGRGGEEAEHLAQHGVAFEVVPGVTAGLSVPIAAGIPVTHRDFSASVALVTGHRRDDKDTREVNWAALASIDTLVFFMSVGKLPEIAQRLMDHGRSPHTPGAIIQQGYWPGEQVVVGTLEQLPALSEAAHIKPPATIIIGDVVQVRDRLLTTLHRELRHDAAEPAGFGLSAQGLFARLTGSARGIRDLEAALSLSLFDQLHHPTLATELAARQGWCVEPLGQMLARLAALGLLVRDADTYCNAEVASRFLCERSNAYQGDALRQLLEAQHDYDPVAALTGGKSIERSNPK